MLMQSTNNDRKEFEAVYAEFLEFSKKQTVPPRIRAKLLLMGKQILGQPTSPGDLEQLEQEEVAQLEQMPVADLIRLFLSVTRCIMGKEDYEFAIKKEAYVRRDAVFAFWHLCYITYSSSSIVITRKKPLELPLEGLRISPKVQKGRNRYSFMLASPKGKYVIGFADEKQASDMYERFRTLLRNKYSQPEKQIELTQSDIPSRLMEEETLMNVQDMDNTQQQEAMRQELLAYGVGDLEDDTDYKIEESLENGRLLVHQSNPLILKVVLLLECPSAETAMDYYVQLKEWNTQLEESSVICRIDENEFIFYERYKAYSIASWARDFVVLKTAIKKENKVYLLEKSVEHNDFPPYMTMVRGNIIRKSTVFLNKNNSANTLMITRIQIDFCGRNTIQDNKSMALEHLRSYQKFPKYCREKSFGQGVQKLFNFKRIRPLRKQSIDGPSVILPTELTIDKMPGDVVAPNRVRQFYRLLQQFAEEEIDEELIRRIGQNEQCWYYLKHKLDLSRHETGKLYEIKDDFIFQKGDWVLNEQNEFVFVNQRAMDAQKDVIKYIIKQIGSNLFSGKSVMNMSLPVDIFDSRSVLQRCAHSFGFAPIFLRAAAKSVDDIERVSWITTFVISTGLLELKIQKPFNPILGQTFQGFLGGIPIDLQQVSHHPPVSAFYMKCEDFTFYGSIFFNVEMGLNSCVGWQSSLYHIVFANGDHFEYMAPGGEVSGLVFGDRKFKLANKGFILERKKQLFSEVSFGKDKSDLYPAKKKLAGCDITGGIFRVTPEFITKFVTDKKREKHSGVARKDILEKMGTIEGGWNSDIIINGKIFRKLYEPLPFKLEYVRFRLPSDSNFRPDILYKRIGNLAQSQRTKQEGENAQRADKKLRSSRR